VRREEINQPFRQKPIVQRRTLLRRSGYNWKMWRDIQGEKTSRGLVVTRVRRKGKDNYTPGGTNRHGF